MKQYRVDVGMHRTYHNTTIPYWERKEKNPYHPDFRLSVSLNSAINPGNRGSTVLKEINFFIMVVAEGWI